MTVHANSITAYHSLNLSERETVIMSAFLDSIAPLTDRECMFTLGFQETNQCRPRITELIEKNLLEECGTAIDSTTGKSVRICRPTVKALEAAGKKAEDKPLTKAQQERKKICQYIARRGDEGATVADVERAFPSIKYYDILNAFGTCWAHGILVSANGMDRDGTVYYITALGVQKLGLPDGTWCKK